MDSSFSLSLKKNKKGKASKRKRTNNVFGNENENGNENSTTTNSGVSNHKKHQRIRITHIENSDDKEGDKDNTKPSLVIQIKDHSEPHNAEGKAEPMTTLEEYKEVPIDMFGDALLRGMGWDGKLDDLNEIEGQKKDKDMTKLIHPESLGIGAKSSGVLLDTDSFLPIKKIPKEEPERRETVSKP